MIKRCKHLFALACALLFGFVAKAEGGGDINWSSAASTVTDIKAAIMNWAENVLTFIGPLVIAGLVFWGIFALVRILKRSFNSGRR